jgi:hypothetical protein
MQWHFVEDGGSVGPVSFDHMRAYLASGRISGQSLVWQQEFGSEWKPLDQVPEFRELLAAAASKPPPVPPGHAAPPPVFDEDSYRQPPQDPPRTAYAPPNYTYSSPATAAPKAYPIYRNHGLGTVLMWLFRIEIIYWVVIAFVPIAWREGGRIHFRTLEEQYRFTLMMESEGWLLFGAIMTGVPAILFLIWKYRLTANLFTLKGRQSVTPAGAIYWYFVPVAFLWKPYEAMRNLFAAHAPANMQGLALTWWLLALLATLIGPVVFFILVGNGVRTVSDAQIYVYGTLAINIFSAISVVAGAEVVKLLTAADRKAVEASGR